MNNEFMNKAKEYALGRPIYPEEILTNINELGINGESVIADIGAGTGLLTNELGKIGCEILAVEPNIEMLNECKRYCLANTKIKYINASTERTQLPDHSIDIITIASAFHWFDKELSKVEFQRILKEDGYVILLWNSMQRDSDFAKEYLSTIGRYKIKNTSGIANVDPDKEKYDFFGQDYKKIYYDNWQQFTEEGVIANAISLSYTPSKLDSSYDEFIHELRICF